MTSTPVPFLLDGVRRDFLPLPFGERIEVRGLFRNFPID